MTEEEIEVLALLVQVWNKFLALPDMHPTDKTEFMHNLHVLQNIVLAREGMRSMIAYNEGILNNKE